MTEEVTFDDFLRVDMRVGRVTAVDAFPEARKPAWKLTPGERVEWRAATVEVPGMGRRLLAFSALVKAVAYMQPAVLAGAISGVNKVAKFSAAAAASHRV